LEGQNRFLGQKRPYLGENSFYLPNLTTFRPKNRPSSPPRTRENLEKGRFLRVSCVQDGSWKAQTCKTDRESLLASPAQDPGKVRSGRDRGWASFGPSLGPKAGPPWSSGHLTGREVSERGDGSETSRPLQVAETRPLSLPQPSLGWVTGEGLGFHDLRRSGGNPRWTFPGSCGGSPPPHPGASLAPG